MKISRLLTRRCMRLLWLLCFGLLVFAACNSSNLNSVEHAREGSQVTTQTEQVLGGSGDYFGYAVAMSGDYALVGQPREETRSIGASAAYIYKRHGDIWQEVGQLLPNDPSTATSFGTTVALDGDIAIIGAPAAHSSQGAVYVFERHDDVWKQIQRLMVSQPKFDDDFAMTVAISGNYLFVGAPGDNEAGERAGAAYIFERQHSLWGAREVQKLLPYTAAPGAQFGRSIAMAGDTALIGAPDHEGVGTAYVFERRNGVWTETTQIQAKEGRLGDQFGYAVAVSDTIAVVGAPYHGRSGAVYFIERQAGRWPSIAAFALTASDGVLDTPFGTAVALSGGDVLVGAHYDGRAVYSDIPGVAYLFTRQSEENWQQRHQFAQIDEQRSPHFGYAVALTGPYVFIGAPGILTGQRGNVYTYKKLLTHTEPISRPIEAPPSSPPNPVADTSESEENRLARITSTPITYAELVHVTPEITVLDPHLSQQTITLNGQPFTPGTTITAAGSYELTVEATDSAGNTSRTTVHFSIEPPVSP